MIMHKTHFHKAESDEDYAKLIKSVLSVLELLMFNTKKNIIKEKEAFVFKSIPFKSKRNTTGSIHQSPDLFQDKAKGSY